jgi:F-type H+-transporting ATPase subunit delta
MKDRILAQKYIYAFCQTIAQENLESNLVSLKEIFDFLVDNNEVQHFFGNPCIRVVHKQELIKAIVLKEQASPQIESLLNLLIQRDRINLMPKFIRILEEEIPKSRNKVKVVFYTASALNNDFKEKIEAQTEKMINRKINSKYIIDKKIIGGIKIKIENKLIDASIQNNLSNIKEILKGR